MIGWYALNLEWHSLEANIGQQHFENPSELYWKINYKVEW